MPAIPNVIRRGAIYYWRRRVPAFADRRKSTTLLLGLRTSDSHRARFLSHQITALTDLHFFPALMNQQLTPQQIQTIFRDVFTRHLDKLDAVAARERMDADFDWRDSRRTDRIMGWVYRLLETRGRNAAVDPCARDAMAADGFGEAEMAEVASYLADMQRQNVVAEPAARLADRVERAGAEPNPVNLALAQEAIHRAMADANFETARRYDGVRVEGPAQIAEILKSRIVCASSGASAEPERRLDHGTAVVVGAAPAPPRISPPTASVEASIAQPVRAEIITPIPLPGLSAAPRIAAVRAAPRPPVGIRPEEHPFMVFAERLIERKKKDGDWDEKTTRQARQIYMLFTKLLLEQSVVELTQIRQSHFGALDDLLSAVATSYGKSPRDEARTTAQLRAIGAGKPPDKRGIAPETRNRHLTFLRQLLTFIKGQGVALDRDIDLTLLRAKTRNSRGRTKRALFLRDELDAIFQLPCFVGCAGWDDERAFIPGPQIYHRALYFAILLLYYTGARREEICGLMVNDIIYPEAEIDGETRRVPCISIDRNKQRRIKNTQSIRILPLLPEVIRLGFLEYVETIRALGYTLVFPDLKSPTSRSPLGDRLYDEFVRGLRTVIPDASERKKVVHSLRKTFGNSLKQAGVAAEIRGDILGHGGETVTEEIYCDAAAIAAMLDQMSHLPVITSHLEAKPIQLIPWVRKKDKPPFSRGTRR